MFKSKNKIDFSSNIEITKRAIQGISNSIGMIIGSLKVLETMPHSDEDQMRLLNEQSNHMLKKLMLENQLTIMEYLNGK